MELNMYSISILFGIFDGESRMVGWTHKMCELRIETWANADWLHEAMDDLFQKAAKDCKDNSTVSYKADLQWMPISHSIMYVGKTTLVDTSTVVM